jgi:hypothetical protein
MSSAQKKKTCVRCNLEKDVSQFGKYTKSKDGLRACCKECKKLEDKNRHDMSKRGPSVQDLIDITIEKMKNDHTDVDVLEQLQKQLEQYIKYKKIENKITETNSFVIRNITNYKR